MRVRWGCRWRLDALGALGAIYYSRGGASGSRSSLDQHHFQRQALFAAVGVVQAGVPHRLVERGDLVPKFDLGGAADDQPADLALFDLDAGISTFDTYVRLLQKAVYAIVHQ